MRVLGKPCKWDLGCCCLVVLSICLLLPCSARAADLESRLSAGEIIFHSEDVPDSPAKRGEAIGVVAAPPEKVWEVVADANKFQEFMPRMLRSRLVRVEELEKILQERPDTAAGVEAILDANPPELSLFRIPGQKYLGYFYGHIDVPWPLRDRWYIVRLLWDETQAADRIYTCSWSLRIGNLQENNGEWKVEPFGDNLTRLTYRVQIDPGGFAPKFLVKEFSTKTLPQIIAAVRGRVASR